jgi:hypothetical protein
VAHSEYQELAGVELKPLNTRARSAGLLATGAVCAVAIGLFIKVGDAERKGRESDKNPVNLFWQQDRYIPHIRVQRNFRIDL